jgi:hypothetical protein
LNTASASLRAVIPVPDRAGGEPGRDQDQGRVTSWIQVVFSSVYVSIAHYVADLPLNLRHDGRVQP